MAPEELINGLSQESYTTNVKEIEGYKQKNTPANSTGYFKDTQIIVKHIYTLEKTNTDI